MRCAEFAKNLEKQDSRDRKKAIDNTLRGQALARAKSDNIQEDLSDPWAWKNAEVNQLDQQD